MTAYYVVVELVIIKIQQLTLCIHFIRKQCLHIIKW